MTPLERLFDFRHAFDSPATRILLALVGVALIGSSVSLILLGRFDKVSPATLAELRARIHSWYGLVLGIAIPICLGASWTIALLLTVSVLCFMEFAKATGLNQSRWAMISALLAILLCYFAVLDHWLILFLAMGPYGVCLILVACVLEDQPEGYLRRVALAVFGLGLFGVSLGHMAYLANDINYRPLLLWLLILVQLNDVFAYLCGKTWGRRKLAPRTSPNKTWEGAIGAIVLTSMVAIVTGRFVFQNSNIGSVSHLLCMGILISALGQLGDLVISSIKRDSGIKDMGTLLPGHGGFLDRFDSLLLVAPIMFHYLNYFRLPGIGADQATQILTYWLNPQG